MHHFETEHFSSFVHGVFVAGGDKHELISPVTGRHFKTLAYADKALSQEAIASSEQAYLSWKDVSCTERAAVLNRVADAMDQQARILAECMTLEMGKPIKQALGEVAYASSYFRWFAGEASRLYGYTLPSSKAKKSLQIILEPVGVCCAITPWNFPLAMVARKVAAALAAGCSMIVRPSRETPISALLLGQIIQAAGVPKGLVNVLIGDVKVVVPVLCASPLVRKLSFTGSTEVGIQLYKDCAPTLKKLSLELGGNAPCVVFDDCDLEKTVQEVVGAKLRNSGQTCVCPNRILVQSGIYSRFVAALKNKIAGMKVGDPRDEATEISTVLHPANKVALHCEDAVSKGAKMTDDGPVVKILEGVTPSMKAFFEETFGPLLALTIFESVQEGIDLANSGDFGLAAYVFTGSIQTAQLCQNQLDYGIVGINDGAPSASEASFGGRHLSGFGREGGPTGLREYCQEKFVSLSF